MWIPIFKTGTHTDSNGNTKTWTEKDIDTIVSKYSPKEHEAPVVIGHPKDNAPAYGWVEGLERKGSVLYAKLKDLVPEFVDIVKKGLYKKRSTSLYPDGTLRHIGFLGASAPAVKGLPDVQFKSSELGIMSYEFEEYHIPIISRILLRLRDWLIEKEGVEEADKIISSWDIDSLKEEPKSVASFAATDEEKEAQQKRSKKYGISIREDGHVTKPSEWDDVPDDEWLDPVNYAYPCPDADQTRAAAVYWGREKNRNKYSEADQEVMNGRLEEFKKKFKIGEQAGKEETNMSFWEKLKELMKSEGIKVDDAPKTFTEAEVQAKLSTQEKEFSEKVVSLDEARKKKDTELKAREDALKAKEAEAKKQTIVSFCEDLKKKGILTPAMEKLGMGITSFMETIASIEILIEFGEGDDKKKQTPLEFMQSFLSALPKAIEFGEVAGRDKDIKSGKAGEKLTALTKKKMEEKKNYNFSQAFTEVQTENPELSAEYAGELKE